jgi:glycosyltransferase involved in cell wall biosynthesis
MPEQASKTVKRIFFEPAASTHPTMWNLFRYPPEGYEFIHHPGMMDRDSRITDAALGTFWKMTGYFPMNYFPVRIFKAYAEKLKRIPQGTAFTYSYNHVIFRKEPWVVQVEYPTMLAGFREESLRLAKKTIEKALASSWCHGILVWSQIARQSMLLNLDCRQFQNKIEVVPQAVPARSFTKVPRNDGRVKFLFVGSTSPGAFDMKGGKETMTAFTRLSRKYSNLELTVRSDVAEDIRRQCASMPNVKLLQRPVPWTQLENEFQTADVFLYPALFPGQDLAPIDAMSYELPVITTDYGANPETVSDGVTGFIVRGSGRIPCYTETLLPIPATPRRKMYLREIRKTEETIVDRIVERAQTLIENPELRQKMGMPARREIETGRLSLAYRNQKLKAIFDGIP